MTDADGYVLLALFLLPLGVALLLIATPSRERSAVIGITGFSSLSLFVMSVYVFARYSFDGSEQFQGVQAWDWIENVGLLGEHGIQLKVGLDGIGAAMVLLTGIVGMAGTWVSWKLEHRLKDFFVLFNVLLSGVFGTFVLLDLFMWFLFYELAVLPMYLLIAVWGSTRKEYGAMKLMMMLVAASILIFTPIFAIFTETGTGTFDMVELFAATDRIDRGFQLILFPMVAVGCGTLAGLFPLHPWSPDGHAAAPTAVSMVHAGVLMKLGAFGVIRLGFQMLPQGAEFWAPALIVLGITGALYGAVSALRQDDLKLMTGFSSVSHMGYVFVGLGTLNVIGMSGAVLQMFAHGVMTALFFLLIGGIYDQAHNRDISNFSGMARVMPVWSSSSSSPGWPRSACRASPASWPSCTSSSAPSAPTRWSGRWRWSPRRSPRPTSCACSRRRSTASQARAGPRSRRSPGRSAPAPACSPPRSSRSASGPRRGSTASPPPSPRRSPACCETSCR